jgi:predicted nucleic-acid-binding Zn-ribbon protein
MKTVTKTKQPAAEGPVCPKCATQSGWAGPVYKPARTIERVIPAKATTFTRVTTNEDECLLWTCNHCGYTRHEPCSSQQVGGQNGKG